MWVIKLENENYYLHEGPTGYAYARSKAKAKRFNSYDEAGAFARNVLNNAQVALVQVKK